MNHVSAFEMVTRPGSLSGGRTAGQCKEPVEGAYLGIAERIKNIPQIDV